MQKKSGRKSKSGPVKGSAGKGPGKPGKAKPVPHAAKTGKSAPKRAVSKTAAKAKAEAKAAPAKAKAPKAKPAAKPTVKRAAKPSAKPAAKPAAKRAAKSAAKVSSKPAAKTVKPSPSGLHSEVRSLPVEIIEAVAARGASVPKAETVPAEDEGLLRNVMDSLTSIFGGKDFMSDAELDALLDSKMASGEIPPSAALDPLDEAQSIIYEAWNSEGPQRVRLAHQALETSRDCADAYVILAEDEARDRKQALDLFHQGVAAAERALDPAVFRNSAGRFWEVMETRPYMRARLGLAECLWEAGKKDEALGHLRELLRLNPADNQGVRYILAQVLLETGEEGELGELLERFRDDASPQIRYSHALWMFRHDGPGRKADALLAEAVGSNPHVPAYLLKRKKFPKEAPRAAGAGSEEEAAAYAMGAAASWQKTLGAADWLAEKTR